MSHAAEHRYRGFCRGVCVLALALLGVGCDDGSGPDLNVARVEVNLASPTLLAGTNASAVARAFDLSGDEITDVPISWRSSQPTIVSVDRNGIMTGHLLGTADIIATIGGVSGSAPITIVPIPVASVSITPGGGPVDRGQSLQLRAIVRDQFGDLIENRTVEWKSSFPGIAQVTAGGLVIAIAAGSTEITATSEGQSATVTINVIVTPVASGPSIETITPAVLAPGVVAVIRGTGFGGTTAQNEVRVAGVPALVLDASPTELRVQLGTTGYGCEPTREVFVQVARGSAAADAAPHLLQSASQRNLAVGESAILTSLAEAQCFELSATGGRYVMSVYNTTPMAQPGAETSFRLRGAKGVIPPGIAAAAPPSPSSFAPRMMRPLAPLNLRSVLSESRRRAADEIHARILDMNLERIRRMRAGASSAAAAGPGALAAVPATQPVGSLVPMKVPNISNFDCANNFPVSTRVAYNGTRAIILEDVTAVFAGQMDTIYQKIGREFDDVMFDVNRATFGDPLRMDDVLDNNGKIIMLFSPRVNQFAGIIGFVVNCDFESVQSSPASNRGEVFYSVVPTDAGTDTLNERTRPGWYRNIRSTIIHELKHISSFAARIRDFGNISEERWIEEGSARLAEEIWARTAAYNGMQQKSNADYGTTVFCDRRPSLPSAPECAGKPFVMGRHFANYYGFLADPAVHSPLGPRLGIPDNSWYGSAWSMLRWVVDHSGIDEGTFFQGLVQTSQTGVANLVARAGRPWEEMLGEWSLAQYVDDLPGFVPANPRLTFPSWDLRSIYFGSNADRPDLFPATYPLIPRAQTFGNFSVSVPLVHGGGFALFELSGQQTGRQLIQLQGANGGDPSARLRVAIVRTN